MKQKNNNQKMYLSENQIKKNRQNVCTLFMDGDN
jgi:hypothetical protein